jgi:site-specific recombinase XerD
MPSVDDALQPALDHNPRNLTKALLVPVFDRSRDLTGDSFGVRFADACAAWLMRSPSTETRAAYAREIQQFLAFVGIAGSEPHRLSSVRPNHVSAWRDRLRTRGLSNAAIMRKVTVLRSLFTFLQTYGYTGAKPVHSHFVALPPVSRDGKTVGLSPQDCRRILDALGIQDALGGPRTRTLRRSGVHRLPH